MSGPQPMALGPHRFEAMGFGFADLSRGLQLNWARHDVVERLERLQFMGPKSETLTVSGVVFPEALGGGDTLEALRSSAIRGDALSLVTAEGLVLGRFVIRAVNEDRAHHDALGRPQRNAYRIELIRHEAPAAAAATVAT